MTQYVNEHAVAEQTGIKIATLRRWRYAGKGFAFYKAGGLVKYELSEVLAWMKAQRRTSTSDPGKAD